ncbi:calcium/calmodulin-dependent protein kinase [Trifolium repens]|nr:calcium/calmodulin-dependent protein kinase [Trifolium repens]
MIGCWSCFGLIRKPRRTRTKRGIKNFLSQGLLTDGETECDEVSYSGDYTSNTTSGDDSEPQNLPNRSEDILNFRAENGLICRPFPVKETDKLVRSEDEDGNKMLNEYIREYKIGSGSYGKVALYRSSVDGKHYAIKSFHKSHLRKLRVAPSETAMTDVLRECEYTESGQQVAHHLVATASFSCLYILRRVYGNYYFISAPKCQCCQISSMGDIGGGLLAFCHGQFFE